MSKDFVIIVMISLSLRNICASSLFLILLIGEDTHIVEEVKDLSNTEEVIEVDITNINFQLSPKYLTNQFSTLTLKF